MRIGNEAQKRGTSSGELFFFGFDTLEFLAGLEADGFAGRDVDLFAGAGIAADSGFAGLDAEDAETAELDALTAAESLLERFENGFDRLLGLGAADESLGHHRIHNVQLDHTRLPLLRQMLEGEPRVVKTRCVHYTDALSARENRRQLRANSSRTAKSEWVKEKVQEFKVQRLKVKGRGVKLGEHRSRQFERHREQWDEQKSKRLKLKR